MRHALAKALAHANPSAKWNNKLRPLEIIQPLLVARPEFGAGGAFPMDWDGCVLPFVHKYSGDIYDCTISVKAVNATEKRANVISVDMRNILPRFAHMDKWQGHALYT